MMKVKKVHDSFGEMEVPEEALYSAQTERAKRNFPIGQETMPQALIQAYGFLKSACAQANSQLGFLDEGREKAIVTASNEVAKGRWLDQFPLSIWQSGSGTQTNMNVNEVIATRAMQLCNEKIHPNDHVNMSQSTNDSFPTAMSIAATLALKRALLPAIEHLLIAMQEKARSFSKIVKIGRTHLMDAVPLTLEQEFSGYIDQLEQNKERIDQVLPRLKALAIGGTAVGTGLNTPKGFAEKVIERLNQALGEEFTSAPNKFSALACHDAFLFAHGALKTLAASLIKIASDLAWLGSGPRAGLGELRFPPNEPGSSIMPGKVNPTQCEAMAMICTHVIGADMTLAMAGSLGRFELNVFKPLIIHHFLQSTQILADGCCSFADRFVKGLEPNKERIDDFLHRSLMLVTALNRKIGYDKAAQIAKKAFGENTTLKEACLSLGCLSAEEFDEIVDPAKMVNL